MHKNYELSQRDGERSFYSSPETECSESVRKTLKGVAKTTYGNVFMIDFVRNKFDFIPKIPTYISILDIDHIEKLGLGFIKEILIEEDQKIFRTVEETMFTFYSNLPTDQRLEYTISFDGHVLNQDNKLVLINYKITPVQLTDNGSIWRAVCNLSLSLNKFAGNIQISSSQSEDVWLYDLMHGKWNQTYKIKLTFKELDVFRFYLQGFTIQEIAKKIHLSVDTVKWHRRKLFEKLNVNNINEALAYVVTNNLL